jgi:hypothetical protein
MRLTHPTTPDDLTELAIVMLRLRQSRSAMLPPDLFGGEQPWDFLLLLFVADGRGKRLTGRMILDRTGGSERTGQRWLSYLAAQDLIVGDGDGQLDDALTLTQAGLHRLELWLAEASTALRA